MHASPREVVTLLFGPRPTPENPALPSLHEIAPAGLVLDFDWSRERLLEELEKAAARGLLRGLLSTSAAPLTGET